MARSSSIPDERDAKHADPQPLSCTRTCTVVLLCFCTRTTIHSARSAATDSSRATSFGDFPDLLATCIGAPRSSNSETNDPNPLLAATWRGVLLSLSPLPVSEPFLRRVSILCEVRFRGFETCECGTGMPSGPSRPKACPVRWTRACPKHHTQVWM